MTDEQFYICYSQMTEYNDKNAFISDMSTSSMWGGVADDENEDVLASRVDEVAAIWDACHRSFSDIYKLSGLSQCAIARKFCIPLRTIENWCSGCRIPPEYVSLMIQRLLGLL